MGRTETLGEQILLDICFALQPEEFVRTLEVDGVRWDCYVHRMPDGRDVTLALSIQKGKAIVGAVAIGRLTEEEVLARLYKQ